MFECCNREVSSNSSDDPATTRCSIFATVSVVFNHVQAFALPEDCKLAESLHALPRIGERFAMVASPVAQPTRR